MTSATFIKFRLKPFEHSSNLPVETTNDQTRQTPKTRLPTNRAMNKKLLLIITAVVALAMPSFAAKTEKDKEGKKDRHGGTVKSVSAESHTLTVARGKKDKSETYKVAKDVDLSKVKVGDLVQLKVSDANVVEAITPAKKKDK